MGKVVWNDFVTPVKSNFKDCWWTLDTISGINIKDSVKTGFCVSEFPPQQIYIPQIVLDDLLFNRRLNIPESPSIIYFRLYQDHLDLLKT